jgi:hypothetical protein
VITSFIFWEEGNRWDYHTRTNISLTDGNDVL